MADIEVPTCRSTITALLNKAYVVMYIFDRVYASGRVEATLRYHFKTLDQKPRPMEPILHRIH